MKIQSDTNGMAIASRGTRSVLAKKLLIKRCVVALTWTFCQAAFLLPALGQAVPKALSKDDVIQLLRGDVSATRVEELAKEHGINFEITRDVEEELRKACVHEPAQACIQLLKHLRDFQPKAQPLTGSPPTFTAGPDSGRSAAKDVGSAAASLPGNVKVAVLNIEQAIFASDEGRREFEALSKESGPKRADQAKVADRILAKMAPAIKKYVDANGIGVLLDTSQAWPKGPVILSRPEADITKAVVAAYDGSSVISNALSAPTDVKVAVVNIEQAIFASNEGQSESQALSKKFAPKQDELKAMANEIDNLKKQLNAQQKSGNATETLARQIEIEQNHYDRGSREAQQDFQKQQGEIGNRILTKMAPAIKKYADDNGIGVLLDTSQQWPRGTIVLRNAEADITEAVVAAYDGSSAVSNTPGPLRKVKVAVVNIEQAILSTDEGKREFEALSKESGPKRADQVKIGERILAKMAPGIKKYVDDNGIGVLLDTSQVWPRGPVFFFTAAADITKAVVEDYNRNSSFR